MNNGKQKKKLLLAVLAAVFFVAAVVIILVMVGIGKKEDDVVVGVAYDYEESGHIKLGEYKGVSVDLTVSDEDVAEEIEFILEDEELYTQVEGTPVEGDYINFNCIAFVDGTEIEDYSEEDVFMTVGDEEYYSEFDAAVITMQTGVTKTVQVPFPENYGDELVDGKTVDFELTVNYIAGDPIKQELTDEFVERYSEGECTSADSFDEYIKETLYQDNVDYQADSAWEVVLENTEVDKYHKGEVKIAEEEEIARYESFSEVTGQDVLEAFGMTEEDVKEIAEEVAKERMIAKTIAAKENLVMTDDEYKKILLSYLEEDGEEEEINAMTLEELEDYYYEIYLDKPREAMFLDFVKSFVADNAEVTGLK